MKEIMEKKRIIVEKEQGESKRGVARQTGYDRKTVSKSGRNTGGNRNGWRNREGRKKAYKRGCRGQRSITEESE
jgi:hypothetical protein